MKTLHKLLFFALIAAVFTACNNTSEVEEKTIVEDTDYLYLQSKLDTIAAINEWMDTSNCAQYSLDFATQHNERFFATFFCDQNGNVHRMQELTSNKDQLLTINHFYFAANGRLFATKSERQIQRDTMLVLVEELNFYGADKTIERSFQKESFEYTEGDFIPSENNQILNTNRIIQAMNNEGEFALTFQGIIKTDNLDYLVVGTQGENNYTSALQIEANTSFIKDIYLHEIPYVGKKIAVNFNREVMGNFSYQVFVAAKWLD